MDVLNDTRAQLNKLLTQTLACKFTFCLATLQQSRYLYKQQSSFTYIKKQIKQNIAAKSQNSYILITIRQPIQLNKT